MVELELLRQLDDLQNGNKAVRNAVIESGFQRPPARMAERQHRNPLLILPKIKGQQGNLR
jgi:hypothetical protein